MAYPNDPADNNTQPTNEDIINLLNKSRSNPGASYSPDSNAEQSFNNDDIIYILNKKTHSRNRRSSVSRTINKNKVIVKPNSDRIVINGGGVVNILIKAGLHSYGTIDKRIIAKVVRQHVGELRSCYQNELMRNIHLKGEITLQWVITQGMVTEIHIKESTVNNQNLEQCVVDAMKHWRYPFPKGGNRTMVEFPFTFSYE